jgi:shikimate dehydrogenase
LNKLILSEYLVIINTTPVGMFPAENDAPPLNYDAITPLHFLFDLIYNPGMTVFLSEGAKRGATIQNGYEMLVIQAEESWKIWTSAT